MQSSTSLQCKESFQDGALLLELSGVIDSVDALDRVITQVQRDRSKNVILILDGVDYINSEGFGSVIRFSDAIDYSTRNVYLVGLKQKVRVVFDTLGVGSMMNVVATLDEALSRIKSVPGNASAGDFPQNASDN